MKYGVTISFTSTAYKEVEAESEEDAIEIVAMMDESEYESMDDGDMDFEAELLDEGNEKWKQN